MMGFAGLHGMPQASLMLLPLFFILSLALLRVRENRTAELLTSQLPEVDVYSKTLVSGYTDITSREQVSEFISNTQNRVSMVKTPILTPADTINLPKGQAFALLEGGRCGRLVGRCLLLINRFDARKLAEDRC